MKIDELIFRGILALAAASLGINSYFIKTKVDEISGDLRQLSETYYQLRIENASRDALTNALRIRLEICENKADNLEERMRSVEVRIGRR